MKHPRRIYLSILSIFSLFLLFCLFFPANTVHAEEPLSLLRITPSGEDVPASRQIVFQFNRPVVPLGDMSRDGEDVPITIKPELSCEWRWLDTSALACQLGKDTAMSPATTYQVTVSSKFSAEDGGSLEKTVHHSFTTKLPRIRRYRFKTWRSPGTPVIRLIFNQPVTKQSVEKAVLFRVQKKGHDDVSPEVKPDPYDKQPPLFLPLPGEKGETLFVPPVIRESDDQPATVQGREARRTWIISPDKELPLDTSIILGIVPGLQSALGPEPGQENRVVVMFDTFPEFSFAGVRCRDISGKNIQISPSDPEDQRKQCEPLSPVSLAFTAPVIMEEVRDNVRFNPDLAGGREDYDPWADASSWSRLHRPHKKGRLYYIHVPELLKAYEDYTLTSTATLKDEFGREIKSPMDLSFKTSHRRPRLQLSHFKSVLEKDVDSDVPLYVTNLGKAATIFQRLTTAGKKTALSRSIEVPDVMDVSVPIPLGVRDMLEGKSGVVQGRVEFKPGVNRKRPPIFFAQVTPFQVHVKLGHYNTLVWVTGMATGEPVSGARVSIYSDSYIELKDMKNPMSRARTGRDGTAQLAGRQSLDPQLKLQGSWKDSEPRLFVRVEKGGEMALLPLDYHYEISTYRASSYQVHSYPKRRLGHIRTWGTTAQGIYRTGDTVQYTLYVRNQDNEGFIEPPLKGYSLQVMDPMDKIVHEVKSVELTEFGRHSGSFTVPSKGAVGWYRFILRADFKGGYWEPMRVLVSDFTPAPFRVETELNGDLFQPEDSAGVTTTASLHAGGPYPDAESRVTADLKAKSFHSPLTRLRGFHFDVMKSGDPRRQRLYQKTANLGSNGEQVLTFPLDGAKILHGTLVVESSVRDERGKYVADVSTASFIARNRLVGLKSTRWTYREDKPAEILFVVVDEKGKPVSGMPVNFVVEKRVTKAARVKGAGNAYLTRYTYSWEEVATGKELSNHEPRTYSFVPKDPGTYRVTATTKDTKNRVHETGQVLWVTGKGFVLWEEHDDGSLEIIPEKEEYGVGDRARYMIKNPYPGAKALVTVERYGVLKSWVETLDSSTPIVEFEVEEDFLPGFYLSVVVTSPRVEKPLGPGNVDLGKPSYRMGYVPVRVKDTQKQVDIGITTDKEEYRPQETVKVDITARLKSPANNQPLELAVAVLDEAVLDLLHQGIDYYDPYSGFYKLESLDLENFSLLTRLVGRQKFEKKGANTGGDGGPDISMRSVFKYVSYWNPSVQVDKYGRAHVEFEVPDNLTSWRIFVIGMTPKDRMGLGHRAFKVNRPTEIRPVMPNQLTEGDSFKAGFSIMNRTDKTRTLTATVTAEGPLTGLSGKRSKTAKYTLDAYAKTIFWLPLETMGHGEILFQAVAGDEVDKDGILHKIQVAKRRSLETSATYGTMTNGTSAVSVQFPREIHTDVGDLSFVAYPSVIGNVEGAFSFIKSYPYTCWEQLLTRAVMADHYQVLKAYMGDAVSWKDSKEVPVKVLDEASAFQAPNGGMTFWKPRDIYASPYLSAYTALAFNWLRKSGYDIPSQVEKDLHEYLLKMLRRETVPSFYSEGMASTVRAVALAALAEHKKVSSKDLERYRPYLRQMSLFGAAHYLMAAVELKADMGLVREITNRILAHANQTGGKFLFSEPWDDGYNHILATPIRANAAILSAMIRLGRTDAGSGMVGDIPFKLVRAISQARGNRDHWENTQENVFCMRALAEYSRIYESVKPDLAVEVFVDSDSIGSTTFNDLTDEAFTFDRPIKPQDPGTYVTARLQVEGPGRLYYATRLSYAPLEDAASRINAGIDIRREYSVERKGKWILLKNPMAIKRGELVRVDIYVSLPSARYYVVVDDPVPGGLEPVNKQLATASVVDAEKGEFKAAGGSWWFEYKDWSYYGVSRWSFYHKELRHDAARFYSDYLQAGNYHLSYTAQAIATGEFAAMPVHAEEMYDPDVYGKGIPVQFQINEP